MAPYLAPFIKTSCVYFIVDITEASIVHAVIKCLPVVALMAFIVSLGIESGQTYNRWILFGLSFCCIGDVLLVWQDVDACLLLLGMAAFCVGHVGYLTAFGFKPFGSKELLFVSFLALFVGYFLMPHIPEFLTIPAVIYIVCLAMIEWRSLARFNMQGDVPWRKIYAAVGTSLFLMSDLLLTINKFIQPLPHEKEVIMVMYYGAQMCIALSAINSKMPNESLMRMNGL